MGFTAITAEHLCNPRKIPNDDTAYAYYIVKNASAVYAGGLAVFEYDSGLTGYVIPATNTANELFAGVFAESGTGDGSTYFKVWRRGWFEFIKTTPAITDVSVEFYCDGGASGADNIIQSGTATGPKVGMGVRYEAKTTGNLIICIDQYCP